MRQTQLSLSQTENRVRILDNRKKKKLRNIENEINHHQKHIIARIANYNHL